LLLSASCHDAKGINLMDVSGDKGRLMIEKTIMHAYFHDDEILVNSRSKGYGGTTSVEKVFSYGSKRLAEDKAYGQQLRSLRNFRDVVLGKAEPLATLEEGFKDDELLNAIYYSSWQHQEITLPLDPEKYEQALKQKIAEDDCGLARHSKKI
jgi:predicted dehydrogenase